MKADSCRKDKAGLMAEGIRLEITLFQALLRPSQLPPILLTDERISAERFVEKLLSAR